MIEKRKPAGLVYMDKDFTKELNPVVRWSYPLGLYAQSLSLLPAMIDPLKRADVSWMMDTYWRERGSKNSLLTLEGLGTTFKILSPLFPALTEPGKMVLGKQQPSLIESIDATTRRLHFLYQYVNTIQSPCISLVSGGSMSYGRFYNIRDGRDPSDLDLMVIFNDGEADELKASELLPVSLGFSRDDTYLLQDRIHMYSHLLKEGKADILSHKSSIEPLNFAASMHIMPSSVFEDMMIIHPRTDLKSGINVDRRVKDYKPEPFKHQSVRLNNFHGEPLFFSVNEEYVRSGVEKNEVITQIPAHAIVEGTFVPGLYHNLLSPRFEMEKFSARHSIATATIFWSLMKRLEKEYKKTNPQASALKSHIRYDLFNPNLIKNHES